MRLNDTTKTLSLALVAIALASEQLLGPSRTKWAAEACLPRLNLFGPFGGGRESAEKPYDREAEKQSKWTTADWIEKNKHPLELHEVTTRDGYRLKLYRLPKPGHRPVLLVHGLLTSSLAWVLLGPAQSLAFLLYAKDYDVWLANTRGSVHGRNHTSLTTDQAEFWSFSFHEVGAFDLPAIVDCVRNESSFHQLFVVTHSEAFNAFLVLLTLHPEYNERILLLQALAPVAELHDQIKLSTPQVKRIAKFVKAKEKTQAYELFKAGELRQLCLKQNSDERTQCLEQMTIVVGKGLHSKSIDPLLFGALLQGGSLKAVEHLQQLWKSGDFVSFDYGVEGNRQAYNNNVDPLTYDLGQVSVPLLLHFGETDALATPSGVHHIYAHLLPCCVIGVYRVPAETFNHLDFVCAPELRRLVNDRLVELIEKFLAGGLQYVIE